MNTAEEKLLILLNTLVDRTRNNKVRWTEEAQDVAFRLPLANWSFLIASADGDGLAPYSIQILDKSGIVREDYDTRETEAVITQAAHHLFQIVRRTYSTAGATIDAVLSELPPEDDIPF